MIYTVPYLLLLLFHFKWSIDYGKYSVDSKQTFLLLVFIFYLFFWGLRGFIGDDFTVYYYFWDTCQVRTLADVVDAGSYDSFEWGFLFLMRLVKSITGNYQVFVFICAFINGSLLYLFLKRYSLNPILSLAVFFLMGGIILQTDLMRNSIAILLFVNALHYIEEKKIVKYFAVCLLAISFHNSSILYFPLYFFLNRRIPRYLFVFLIIIANIVYLLQINLVSVSLKPLLTLLSGDYSELYANYVEEGGEEYGITVGYLERLFTSVMIILYYKRLMEQRASNVLFINSFLIYIFFFYMLTGIGVVAVRMGNLFVYSYWILWPGLYRLTVKNRKLFFAFMLLYGLLKVAGTTRHAIYRYDNALFGIESYEERVAVRERNQE